MRTTLTILAAALAIALVPACQEKKKKKRNNDPAPQETNQPNPNRNQPNQSTGQSQNGISANALKCQHKDYQYQIDVQQQRMRIQSNTGAQDYQLQPTGRSLTGYQGYKALSNTNNGLEEVGTIYVDMDGKTAFQRDRNPGEHGVIINPFQGIQFNYAQGGESKKLWGKFTCTI